MIQEKKRVLGRGLESLIPAARAVGTTNMAAPMAEAASGELVREIRLEEIEPSPYQPRRRHDEAALEELAQSIRAQGVLQPIVVRYIPVSPRRMDLPHPTNTGLGGPPANGEANEIPHPTNIGLGGPPADTVPSSTGENPHPTNSAHAEAGEHGSETRATPSQLKYQLIAGERRWLASRLAGRGTVPAIVRQVSNEQAMEMALIENLQREDLDCMEMACAFDRLGREFGLTHEQMAQRTGKDRTTVGNYLRLLKLPPDVRAALVRHDLSFSHAKSLMSLEDETVLSAAAQKIMREEMSVRATEELVNHLIWMGPVKEQKPVKQQRPEDPNVKAARMDLESRLGCRVKIVDHSGKGKVVIEYKSLEDFDRIVEALGK